MYKMVITRYNESKVSTIGKFILLDNERNIIQEGYTLEPAGPDTIKRNQDRRIPIGKYDSIIRFSPRFKLNTPLLYNETVPYDRYILIHVGNYPDDTDGCILVGDSVGKNAVWT